MEVQKVGLKNEAMERELREELQDLEREKIWGTHYVQPLRFVEFNLMQPPPPPPPPPRIVSGAITVEALIAR